MHYSYSGIHSVTALIALVILSQSIILSKMTAFKSYAQIVNQVNEIRQAGSSFVQVKEAYDKFSDIKQPMCGEEACSFPIIEITNQSNGQAHIRSLPIILAISGFCDHDLDGTSIILNLAKQIINGNVHSSAKLVYFLNNYRLLLVPMANPQGIYYNRTTEEVSPDVFVEVSEDFTVSSKHFVSSASQIISAIFKNYVIGATIVFRPGDLSILYADGSEDSVNLIDNNTTTNNTGSSATSDFVVIEAIAKRLSQWSEFYLKSIYARFMYQSIRSNHKSAPKQYELDVDQSQTSFLSSFAIWASGRSDQSGTNGSLVLQINTGKYSGLLAKEYKEELFGSPEVLFNEMASKGIYSFIMESIFEFAYFLLPKVSLIGYGLEANSQSLVAKLEVRGCIVVDRMAMQDPVQHSIVQAPSSADPLAIVFDVSVKNNNSFDELTFEMNCDNKWSSIVKKLPSAHTHYLRSKLDPNYLIELPNSEFRSQKLVTFSLANFNQSMMTNSVVFSPFRSCITLIDKFQLSKAKSTTAARIRALDIIGNFYETQGLQRELSDQMEMTITEFNDFGVDGTGSRGSKIKIDATYGTFHQMSDLQFLALIGKGVQVSPRVKKPNTSPMFSGVDMPEKLFGLRMPPSGCVCSSQTDKSPSNDYYYLSLLPLKQDLIGVELLIFQPSTYHFSVFEQEARLYLKDEFNIRNGNTVYSYWAVIDPRMFQINGRPITDLRHYLLGAMVLIRAENDQQSFVCNLQAKNPGHNEKAHLQFGFQTQGIFGKTHTRFIAIYIALLLCAVVCSVILMVLSTKHMLRKRRMIRFQSDN